MNTHPSFIALNYETLIAQLNGRGLFAQAQELRQAWNLYKQAEVHLYKVFDEEGEDILNFSHPDGNVEILPAQNRQGEIHTIQSTQRQILDSISHQPSDSIRQSILTAGKVLNIDLEKFAQNLDVDVELMSPETRDKIVAANKQTETILAANQQNLQSAVDATGIIDNELSEDLKFTEEKILGGQGVNFYLKTLKGKDATPQGFQKFKVAYSNLSQGQPITIEHISKLVLSLKNYDAILDFFNSIDPSIASAYFMGSNIIGVDKDDNEEWNNIQTRSAKDSRYKNNPNSIWTMSFKFFDSGFGSTSKGSLSDSNFHIDNGRLQAAAANVHKWIMEWKGWFISDEKINAANQALLAALSPLKTDLESLRNSLEPKAFMAANKIIKTTGLAIGKLQSINAITDEKLKKIPSFGEIYNGIGAVQIPERIVNHLNASRLSVQRLVEILSEVQLNPILDQPINEALAAQIATTFRELAIIWRNYSTSGEVAEEDIATVEGNFNQGFGIYSNVTNHANKPFAFILQQISPWVPKVKTPEQLLQTGQEQLAYVKSVVPAQFQVQAQVRRNLTKQAQAAQALSQEQLDRFILEIRDFERQLNTYLSKPKVTTNSRAACMQVLQSLSKAKNILVTNKDKPFNSYANQFNSLNLFDDTIETPQDLINEMLNLSENIAYECSKVAAVHGDLPKLGFAPLKGKPGAGGAKPAGTSNKPSGGQAGHNNVVQGLKKFDPDDPAQVAVAQMQLALNNFGRLIANGDMAARFPKLNNYDPDDGLKIIGTGPKSNPHLNMFDGIWSTNTNNALTLAQKYLGSLGQNLKLGVKWQAASKSHTADTASEAQANTVILRKVSNYLSGQKGDKQALPDNALFDQLPQSINWDLESGPSQASFDKAEIPVTKGDLASLQSFYDFLTSKGLRAPETSGSSSTDIGTEGFTPKTWNESLQWFVRRAVLKYNALKGEGAEAAATAKEYFDRANALLKRFQQMMKMYLVNPRDGKMKDPSQVINPNLIAEFSRGFGGNTSNDLDSGQSAAKGNRIRRNQESQTVEEQAAYLPQDAGGNSGRGGQGRDGSRFSRAPEEPITLPFADTINLRDEMLWEGFDGSELASPILRLKDFQKVPGVRMAQLLFAPSNNPQKAQRVAIENLGYNPIRFDERLGEWMIKASPDGKVVVPASRVLNPRQIQQAMQTYMSAAPTMKYQKFLGDLQSKIGQVLQEWSQEAPEDMIIHVQDYYKYWQQAIAKQMRDITRARS